MILELKHLVDEGYVCLRPLSIEHLKTRVSIGEKPYISDMTTEMATDDDIPLRKTGARFVYVTDAREARDFVLAGVTFCSTTGHLGQNARSNP